MKTLFLHPLREWTGSFTPPSKSDIRWKVAALLTFYLVLGVTFLGFSRNPWQMLMVVGLGMVLDVLFTGFFKGVKIFPLSAMISCLSLSILLNYTLGFQWIWIPVFVTIGAKHLLIYKGRHIYNPSLFGICFCLLFGGTYITLSPSYQWYGAAESAYAAGFFIITGALFLFAFKIRRNWLIFSFLFFFMLQTLFRAIILQHVIPPSTLFLSSLVTPSFYLFTFYMITDPGTSPKGKWEQIGIGFLIALFDLYLHTKFNLFTFFYAGIMAATLRFLYIFSKDALSGNNSFFRACWEFVFGANDSKFSSEQGAMREYSLSYTTEEQRSAGGNFASAAQRTNSQHAPYDLKLTFSRLPFILLAAIPFFLCFTYPKLSPNAAEDYNFTLEQIPASHSGLDYAKSDIFEQLDPRLQHVGKWILSVGDAVASADVDLDGDQDLFLTQPLKSVEWRAKLYLNEGDFTFTKTPIPDLEQYLNNPKENGLNAFSFFLDYDNDGDKDLFTGFGFGESHLFENRIIPDGQLSFIEKEVPFLKDNHTVCLGAAAMDIDGDNQLDILLCNALMTHLEDYEEPTPLNVFDLPQPAYEDDRRMFRFMHASWHNANNGGMNYLMMNKGAGNFEGMQGTEMGMPETRWSLAASTADLNDDGFTDLYIANDFGRDDCYLNVEGKRFERQEGVFFGDIGLDTYKGMNSSFGDLDGNLKDDAYISNVHHELQAEGSLLWLNHTEKGSSSVQLQESANKMNLLNINRFGWGGEIGDINLDGFPDVVQTNGMVGDDWDKIYDKRMDYWYFQAQIARTGPNVHSYADNWADIRGMSIYENERDRISLNLNHEKFIDVADVVGLDHEANTRGIALSDLDNDGDLDLIFTDQFGAPKLYKNNIAKAHWIGFQLEGDGKEASADAVGTKLYLHYKKENKAHTQYREIRLVNGFMSQSDAREVFGLGEGATDLQLEVKWMSGKTEVFDKIEEGAYYTVQPGRLMVNDEL